MTVPFSAAGSPAYSQIIFNIPGEQAWQFRDHVCLVIIAIHILNAIITILRTWLRWNDIFELPSIAVEGDPHKIISAEIANNLQLAQVQLLKATESDASKRRVSDPIMIRRIRNSFSSFLNSLERLQSIFPRIELQSELLKARQTFVHDSTHDHYHLGYLTSFRYSCETYSELKIPSTKTE